MTNDMTPDETGPRIAFHGERRVALHWQNATARFHVWLDDETGRPLTPGDVIFKNPPASVEDPGRYRKRTGNYGDPPGFFETRRLKLSVPKNAALVESLLSRCSLATARDAFERAAAEREAAEARELEAAIRRRRRERAAPALYAALTRLVEHAMDGHKPGRPCRCCGVCCPPAERPHADDCPVGIALVALDSANRGPEETES